MKRALLLAAALAAAGCAGNRSLFPRGDALKEPRARFEAGEYAKVIALLPESRILELPRRDRALAYHLLGTSHNLSNKSTEALQIFQLGVGLYPRDLKLLTDLAALLHSAGLPQRARPYYARVLSIHPNNAGGNLGIAKIYRSQGFLAKAIEHYQVTLRQWRDNPRIWYGYAQVLADAGKLDESLAAARTSLDYLYDADTLRLIARLSRRRANTDDAYENLRLAMDAAPGREEFLLENALWLLEDGRLDEARVLSERALSKAGDDPLARWLRASIALRRGHWSQAREDLTVSAEAARTHPFIAQTAQAMLKELPAAP